MRILILLLALILITGCGQRNNQATPSPTWNNIVVGIQPLPYGLDRLTQAGQEITMVNFVKAIANYARVTKGKSNFAVFPNNGENLSSYTDYVQAVTGIGKESLWYSDNTAQSDSATASAISKLDIFKNAGKTVLVLEYPTQTGLINDFYSKAIAKNYIPYATIRDLNALTINSNHEPD